MTPENEEGFTTCFFIMLKGAYITYIFYFPCFFIGQTKIHKDRQADDFNKIDFFFFIFFVQGTRCARAALRPHRNLAAVQMKTRKGAGDC